MSPTPDEIRRLVEGGAASARPPQMAPEPAHTIYFFPLSGFGVADGSALPAGVGLVGPAGGPMPVEDVTVIWFDGPGPTGAGVKNMYWFDGPGLRRFLGGLASRFDPEALDILADDLRAQAEERRKETAEEPEPAKAGNVLLPGDE